MIDYDPEVWGVAFIFRISGSVFPKGLMWAIPSAALSVLLHMYFREEGHEFEDVDEGIRLGISSYSVALSFLVIFRTQQAYSRWWEGGSLLQTMRGEWYNAFSNLLSFTTRNPERRSDVDAFQHLLVRFMSLLHGTALQQVSTTSNLFFELVDLRGVDTKHLEFLKDCEDRCEVVMQWVQRITVEAFEGGILPIPAPILSRVFQELSRGIVNLANARKISELPFPFPYAQMITVSLIIHWVMMPLLMGIYCNTGWVAGFLTFVTVTSLWSINYVAQEIESPYGDDDNDLPLMEMQMSFNRNLVSLMMPEAQEAPTFNLADVQAMTESANSPVCTQTTTKTLIDDLCSKPSPRRGSPAPPGLAASNSNSSFGRPQRPSYLSHDRGGPMASAKRESAFTMQAVERYDQRLRLAAIQTGKETQPCEAEFTSEVVLDPAPHGRDAGAGPPEAPPVHWAPSTASQAPVPSRTASKRFTAFRFNWRGSTVSGGAAAPPAAGAEDPPVQRRTFPNNRLVTGTLVPPRHTLVPEQASRGGDQPAEPEDVYARRSI